ncbi:NAD/NADP octopine/nopaline dehydrogenase family protein [Tindallia californiensis]|uniref:Opine dehydrogenase n=1 Tax=Tindallia californiensis TaxID=159292 RepID=A0A1H3LAM1_9FIRM|nr:NAD/NADP octopine/nopaline dehydrogenase family protein [Tindallia californiensis]SDY61336.1 opine dehydrogenase [Tindallia californiensis]
MKLKVCIIGSGNGALAAAADLTLQGHQVNFYVNDQYRNRLESLFSEKTIQLDGVGATGKATLNKVTSNIDEALEDVDLIMPVLPAYTIAKLAEELAEHLKPDARILLAPGSTGGALIMARKLYEKLGNHQIRVAEIHSLPYAARSNGEQNEALILLECKKLYFATFPSKYNDEMAELTKHIYPSIEPVRDVLESSLNNGNPVSHPAPVVLNAGKIEYFNGEHYHYREGITPSVARVNERVDQERLSICQALGYKGIPAVERLYKMGYAPKRETLYECYRDSNAFNPLKGPSSLQDRYLVEDTKCSLVALASLGDALGIETPVMDSVIVLASALNDEDYYQTGCTVQDWGLEGKSLGEIKTFLQEGYNG